MKVSPCWRQNFCDVICVVTKDKASSHRSEALMAEFQAPVNQDRSFLSCLVPAGGRAGGIFHSWPSRAQAIPWSPESISMSRKQIYFPPAFWWEAYSLSCQASCPTSACQKVPDVLMNRKSVPWLAILISDHIAISSYLPAQLSFFPQL